MRGVRVRRVVKKWKWRYEGEARTGEVVGRGRGVERGVRGGTGEVCGKKWKWRCEGE